MVGSLGVGEAGGDEVMGSEGISRELFSKWLELREMRYGNAVAKWWCCMPAAEEGDDDALKQGDDDTVADLYAAIERAVRQACAEQTKMEAGKDAGGLSQAPGESLLRSCAAEAEGALTVKTLAAWCSLHVTDELFESAHDIVETELLER